MSQDKIVGLLQEIVRRILAVSAPEQIILFGSYARGEAGPDSDLDLLVIERGVEAPLFTRNLLVSPHPPPAKRRAARR